MNESALHLNDTVSVTITLILIKQSPKKWNSSFVPYSAKKYS